MVYGVRKKVSKEMEWPYANKCYLYQFKKDITTGTCSKNTGIFISSFKIKFQSFHAIADNIRFSLVTNNSKLYG